MSDTDTIVNHVTSWLEKNKLELTDIDCATAVMLKILDGKCKMPTTEKVVMAELYHQVKHRQGMLLDHSMHMIIQVAGDSPKEETRLQIYEHRVLAETQISRPTMKAFKAMIRKNGLLDIAIA